MSDGEQVDLREHDEGVVVPVLAHAGARREGVLGVRQGRLRVAVSAAPEKGKANKAIAAVLADFFGVAASRVELAAGATNPQKRLLVRGLERDAAREAIAAKF
ncbi:hypothetical protein Mal64_08140 [Pseudobythopirellula maris]|uniref:UPF0235 protein Mal64_08140 n=1 Tax=Pseudobythopirellula maris TaxID=2527991 RepID=A0A5C5ZTM0_9BACT|nr:DUF167 family protein [Pseudobythopirellula maris]TWT90425.1 hypothetical protein Mal64_08140 [Pseudobythopirellula maris]